MRFPKGRATERVVSDLLTINEGLKRTGPIPMSEPITDAAITDVLTGAPMPEPSGTVAVGTEIEQAASEPAEPGRPGEGDLPGVVMRGGDIADAF